jgi:hypothetical protein
MRLRRPESTRRPGKRYIDSVEEQDDWRSRGSLETRRLNEGLIELWSADDPTGSDRYRLMSDAVGEPL